MPLSAVHRKVRTSTVSAHQRQHQYICHHCQLGHVIPGYAILVAVCILMLPMLKVAAEHALLTTTHHLTNPADLRDSHMTFHHSPLVLPSFSNVLPSMALQNKVVKHLSCSFSKSSICHVSLGLGFSVPSSMKMMMMVVTLLLLLSGDIETNPGPVGEHIVIYSSCQFD